MTDQDQLPQRFGFKGVLVVAAACAAFVIFGVYVCALAINEGSIWGGIAFLLCDLLVFGFVGFNIVLSRSDVLITEHGISRALFGAILQTLRWDEVDKIYAFKMVNGNLIYQKVVRVFTLYPKSKLKLRFIGASRLMFDQEVQNVDELVKLINLYAAQYKIPLTDADINGVKRSVSSL